MNYTRITINGVEYPLRFGMASFRYLGEKNIQNLDEIGISHVVYSGHYNHCLVNEVLPSLNFADVVDYVENALQGDATELNQVLETWTNSQLMKKATEDTKKKTTGKKSKG